MPFASEQEFTITQVTAKLWRLDSDIIYFDSRIVDYEIVIPAGTVADGSSIPRVVWWMFGHPFYGGNGIIGFTHDYISQVQMFSRLICDKIFLEAHEDYGTGFWARETMYRAVRINSIVRGYK